MACKRDRIIAFVNYLESLGIEVNISKNKARGNKGFFRTANGKYRIDVAKNQSDENIKSILIHEFMHFVHYSYDKTLKTLNFIFKNYKNEPESELIDLTVDSIPKDSISPLFNMKDELSKKIEELTESIKVYCPNFSHKTENKELENIIKKKEYRYLLNHDRVKVLYGFSYKFFSIQDFDKNFPDENPEIGLYLKIKSAKRGLRRINSKISRLNRYYNSPTELLARSFEYYICKPEIMKSKTPDLYDYYQNIVIKNSIPMITTMCKCFDSAKS